MPKPWLHFKAMLLLPSYFMNQLSFSKLPPRDHCREISGNFEQRNCQRFRDIDIDLNIMNCF